MKRRCLGVDISTNITTPVRNALSAAIAVIMLSSPYAEAQTTRSTRIDVGSDISNPIRTSLSTTISSDPQGRNPLTTKTIQIEINYKTPQTPGYVGSNSNSYITPDVRGPRGYTGSVGLNGNTGPRGYTGSAGTTGVAGYTGSQGIIGYTGSAGTTGGIGFTGSRGAPGNIGNLGFTGSAGLTGFVGSAGFNGIAGSTGTQGNIGFTGSVGDTGSIGVRGYTGSIFNSFKIFRVSGQSTVIAGRTNATLDINSGVGITLAASSNSITVSSQAAVTGANSQVLISNGTGGINSSNNLRYDGSNLSVVGNITASRSIVSAFSDDRLKTRVGKITDAVDKLKTLTGFFYKSNEIAKNLGYDSNETQLGISAQDVVKVFPEIVSEAPLSSEYMTVQYDKLIPVLIEAVKEQDLTINNLRTQIATLEGLIENQGD